MEDRFVSQIRSNVDSTNVGLQLLANLVERVPSNEGTWLGKFQKEKDFISSRTTVDAKYGS